MIALLINLIVWLLIIGVIFWAVRYIAAALPLDPVIRNVINVVITVVAVIVLLVVLLQLLGALTHIDIPRVVQ